MLHIASCGLLISIPVTCFYYHEFMSFVFHFIPSDIHAFIVCKVRKLGSLSFFLYPTPLPSFSSFSSLYLLGLGKFFK